MVPWTKTTAKAGIVIRAHQHPTPELPNEHKELILLRPLRPGLVGKISGFLFPLLFCLELVKP